MDRGPEWKHRWGGGSWSFAVVQLRDDVTETSGIEGRERKVDGLEKYFELRTTGH